MAFSRIGCICLLIQTVAWKSDEHLHSNLDVDHKILGQGILDGFLQPIGTTVSMIWSIDVAHLEAPWGRAEDSTLANRYRWVRSHNSFLMILDVRCPSWFASVRKEGCEKQTWRHTVQFSCWSLEVLSSFGGWESIFMGIRRPIVFGFRGIRWTTIPHSSHALTQCLGDLCPAVDGHLCIRS